ncbi:MAG: DUF4363 family protein [Clostridia bacterium]|nr:DUF4363 family protein [Clostridia bacterium]
MKRSIWVMCVILVLMIAAWQYQSRTLEHGCRNALLSLEEIATEINQDRFILANRSFSLFKENWDKEERVLSLMISHDEIDDIQIHSHCLSHAISMENKESALYEIVQLTSTYRSLWEKFNVNFKNIL